MAGAGRLSLSGRSCVVSARRSSRLPNPLKDNPNWLVVRDRALVPAGARMRGWRDWVVANDPVYAAARRPGPPEKIAAGVTLLLVAAVVLFLILFDWNMLRGPIGRAGVKVSPAVALVALSGPSRPPRTS